MAGGADGRPDSDGGGRTCGWRRRRRPGAGVGRASVLEAIPKQSLRGADDRLLRPDFREAARAADEPQVPRRRARHLSRGDRARRSGSIRGIRLVPRARPRSPTSSVHQGEGEPQRRARLGRDPPASRFSARPSYVSGPRAARASTTTPTATVGDDVDRRAATSRLVEMTPKQPPDRTICGKTTARPRSRRTSLVRCVARVLRRQAGRGKD